MAWTINYTKTAKQQLRKLDKQSAQRILDYMSNRVVIGKDPRALGKVLSGPLGAYWRYRVGDFRIICDIQDSTLSILVVRLGSRKEIYRGH